MRPHDCSRGELATFVSCQEVHQIRLWIDVMRKKAKQGCWDSCGGTLLCHMTHASSITSWVTYTMTSYVWLASFGSLQERGRHSTVGRRWNWGWCHKGKKIANYWNEIKSWLIWMLNPNEGFTRENKWYNVVKMDDNAIKVTKSWLEGRRELAERLNARFSWQSFWQWLK